MEKNVILQQCSVSELAQVVTETVMERMGDIFARSETEGTGKVFNPYRGASYSTSP